MHNAEKFLSEGGEAGRVARAVDWAKTALGPTSGWSEALKNSVASCLGSEWPTIVMWGAELICIYNDAYSEIILEKHPRAMGRRAQEAYAELWERLKPIIDRVIATGNAVRYADQRFDIERRGVLEERISHCR